MGKKAQGMDSFQRMNFLYQASLLSKNISDVNAATTMSTYYSNLLVNVAKKSVLRLDQELKRNICKYCHGLLIPGQTARVRVKSKRERSIKWTCLKCNSVKRFLAKPYYRTWNELPEALVSVINYSDERNDDTETNVAAENKIKKLINTL